MTLKFANEESPARRVVNAIGSMTESQFISLKGTLGSDRIVTVNGAEMRLMYTDSNEDSYGDTQSFAVVDTPNGLYKFRYDNSYGGFMSPGDTEYGIDPVKMVSKPEFEYDSDRNR